MLYIDDDKTSHKFVPRFLSGVCSVECCLTADEAIELVHKNKYDLIFIDINLGFGKSGIDVLKHIRGMKDFNNAPLVAVTAYAMLGDEQIFLAEGFDHYVSKPVTKDKLINFVKDLLPA